MLDSKLRHRTAFGLCLLISLVVLGTGCRSMGRSLEPPEVSLIDVAPLPSVGLEQRFEVTIRVTNPNAVALSGDGVDLSLDLNGRRLGRALSSERFEVPRLGDQVVKLVATTNLFDVFRQAMALPSSNGQLEYELNGRVLLSGSMGWLNFSRKGRLVPDGMLPGE